MRSGLLQTEVVAKGAVQRAADGLELSGRGDAVAEGRKIVSSRAKQLASDAMTAQVDGDPSAMDAAARQALEAVL